MKYQDFSCYQKIISSSRAGMLLIPGTGNGERGTGNGEPGTGVWELMYSGHLLENSKWRSKQKKGSKRRHAIRDSASPRPKMYWTRTFEELVPSLDTTSNSVQYLYCSYENESL